MKTPIRRASICLFALTLSACATRPAQQALLPAAAAHVPETYTTTPSPADNIDSVTTWPHPDGRTWLIATAKDVDNLVVFDAQSGANLRRFGATGTGLGQFRRPNGLAVIDDLLFVVERDNHRVQVLQLPGLTPIATFGDEQLRVAYGLWIQRADNAEFDVYVTDSYQQADGEPPSLPELAQRVHLFRIARTAEGIRAEHRRTFGDTTEAGALRWVESILGDPSHDRLMIAEEHLPTGTALRVYDMSGRYSGRDLGKGLFKGQAEGIALFACADGSGYWLATDQDQGGNVFHVFDRASLELRGSFAGSATQNTDGIHMLMQPNSSFPAGTFFAVHDDRAVSAFDWRDIAKALNLREKCP